ncbi:hypothetical protein [Alkalimarinus alittae]|uniref:Lipoprotein n=1 Tax=Alkalimarinus alittae TaxID=2961619 RepID=A0ABY6MZP3_9ALTE|nr:hypothetical protein [Alkalimarinus alittae]UZE95313.1 hypothetical protein NKI27_14755 [Alkalimarinus alittae]
MKLINYGLILFALFLSGCGTMDYHEYGFEVNLNPASKPKQVWVAPLKPSEVIDWSVYLTQIRVNLAEELERKSGMTVSTASAPTVKDDYRMYLRFDQYEKLLDHAFGSGTFTCNYNANLTVKNNQDMNIFSQQSQQAERYTWIHNSEAQYTSKADDACFQARNRLMETLLGDFLKSVEGH